MIPAFPFSSSKPSTNLAAAARTPFPSSSATPSTPKSYKNMTSMSTSPADRTHLPLLLSPNDQ